MVRRVWIGLLQHQPLFAAAADLGCSVQTVGCFDTPAALVDRLQTAD